MIVEDVMIMSAKHQYVVIYDNAHKLYEGNVLSIPVKVLSRHVKCMQSIIVGIKVTALMIDV